MNMMNVTERDDGNNDNHCKDVMVRNNVNMTLMSVILDAPGGGQCLVAQHSGSDGFTLRSLWSHILDVFYTRQ